MYTGQERRTMCQGKKAACDIENNISLFQKIYLKKDF